MSDEERSPTKHTNNVSAHEKFDYRDFRASKKISQIDCIGDVNESTTTKDTSEENGTLKQSEDSMAQRTNDISTAPPDSDDLSIPSVANLLENFNIFDHVLDHEEYSSYSLDLEDADSEIQAAINDIRKEASQMDVILALDQLKTLQSELEAVNKQFSARSMENEELKIQLEEKEDRVATLELERDLYQADADKLREDLKTCVEKMFDISLYESKYGNETKHEPIVLHGQTLLRAPSGEQGATLMSERAGKEKMPESQDLKPRTLGLSDQPRKVFRRLSILSDPDLLRMHSKRQWSDDSDSVHLLPSKKNGQEVIRNQEVFRKRGCNSFRRQRSESNRSLCRHNDNFYPSRSSGIQRGISPRHKSFSIETKTYHKTLEKQREEKENRICGIFRRRVKHGNSLMDDDVRVMQDQISQLHAMMKVSLAASEKLRKRLAAVSGFYEGVVSKLQDQVVEIKTEKSRTEVLLRNEISRLELELRRKSEEIVQLREISSDEGEV
jgi:hypothetical protein